MGRDLTFHVELKINNKWHHYNHGKVYREPYFFDFIAGFEEKNVQVFPLKGLPDDITEITAIDKRIQKDDYHSATWLTAEELNAAIESFGKHCRDAKIKELVEDSFGFLYSNYIWHFNTNRKDYPKEIQDVRIVLWFDN